MDKDILIKPTSDFPACDSPSYCENKLTVFVAVKFFVAGLMFCSDEYLT